MLQNATPLRKSAPGPPNSSDEHVSCTAPATENTSLQILFKCPTPAIVFGNATKPSRFAHFWQGAESLAPARQNHIWTFNFQKWSEHGVLCSFWLGNVLRATTACTFSTSQLPKVVWEWCFLHTLTWKCASRHNSVQLFISYLATWLLLFDPPEPQAIGKHSVSWLFYLLLWLFPPLLFHVSIFSEVWLKITSEKTKNINNLVKSDLALQIFYENLIIIRCSI